jgi:hypothetical protein
MSEYGFKKGEGRTLPMVISKTNAISRGRFVNKIEYIETEKAEYLTIEVIDKAGNTARAVYFPPKKGMYIKTDEDLKKEQRRINAVLENLTKTLLGSEYETGDVDSFKAFCKKVISDIGRSFFKKELRVKVVYDNKNRATLPKWPVIFEDPTVISDENTKMKITQWDKVEASEIKMDTDLQPDKVEKKDELDDLPFGKLG